MAKSKTLKAGKKVASVVTTAYNKVEGAVVGTYTKIEDAFVERYLTKDGETVDEAKKRLKEQNGGEA